MECTFIKAVRSLFLAIFYRSDIDVTIFSEFYLSTEVNYHIQLTFCVIFVRSRGAEHSGGPKIVSGAFQENRKSFNY